MQLTSDELLYIKNLIKTSGDIGCHWRIGLMKDFVDCKKLYEKIERMICQK